MGGPSRAWLVGTEGTAVVDVRQPAVQAMIRRQIVEADYTPPVDDPMQWASGPPLLGSPIHLDNGLGEGLEDLVRAIDEDRSPHYSVQQARDNMEILLAGYRSIVEGAPVALPLPDSA
jgi:predicted dehydrogenase